MPLSARVNDLTSFDLLLSVARLGSVGAAARAHGMTQPAASSRLSHLERRLGLQLLERSPRGSRLTEHGALVADWAREAVQAAAAMDAGLLSLRGSAQSRLRVAASQTVAEYLLPHWLAAFQASVPDAAVALTAGNSDDVAAAVLDGRADLGFVEGPQIPSGLSSKQVARDQLAVIVAPRHPWARRRSGITADELAATPLIAREHGSGTRRYLERALAARTSTPLAAPLLELPSTTAIKTAVADGIAPAVLSSLAVAADLANRSILAVPVQDFELHRDLRMVHPRGRKLLGPALELAAIARRDAASGRRGGSASHV
ncbi:LysR family transcriptional regulator [Streptomyces sp. NPDC050743]|uniref:LysR family transcriptional regulator n=1 Tax=Streptomyces sp. NPDC050743 TaxID=3365634 RepID=UPI0037B8F770